MNDFGGGLVPSPVLHPVVYQTAWGLVAARDALMSASGVTERERERDTLIHSFVVSSLFWLCVFGSIAEKAACRSHREVHPGAVATFRVLTRGFHQRRAEWRNKFNLLGKYRINLLPRLIGAPMALPRGSSVRDFLSTTIYIRSNPKTNQTCWMMMMRLDEGGIERFV